MCWRLAIAMMGVVSLASFATAADVEADVSTKETYVGIPVRFRIQINNAVQYKAPTLPDVDGLVIESIGAPSRSSRTTIINGRKTVRNSVIFTFRVTPQRAGTFTIPPIRVSADGRAMVSKAVRIVASKSEPSDLIIVEIEGKEKEIYVGEALNLTLRLWIRPYRDQKLNVTLNERNVWNLISEQSNWGPFAESLREMAEDNERPGGQSVLRQDADGNEREYLLYEIDATVYPDRPGQIDADDVRIVISYPLELGRGRSPLSMFGDDDFPFGGSPFDDSFFSGFTSRLQITKSKPLVAEASIDQINVKPIPIEDRPDDYRGAVGHYSIITEAKPVRSRVGDPITLHIAVDGNGRMDLLRAPPIESQQSLTERFKVPDEPLAGFVDGSRKVFTTTIRPKDDSVTEIPPVSFSYFDPDTGKFVTTLSDPIPIQVEKAEVLALDAIVSGTPRGANRSDIAAEKQQPSQDPETKWALLGGADLLQSVPRPMTFPTDLIAFLVVPPLIAMAVMLITSRHALGRFVNARRELKRALESAGSCSEVAEAMERYLAKRFRVAQSRLTRAQTVGRLRATGNQEMAIRTERLYANCERSTYDPVSEQTLQELKNEASEIADGLGRKKFASGPRTGKPRLSSTSAALLSALCGFQWIGNDQASAEVVLTPSQQNALLSEAFSISKALPDDLPVGTWNEDLAKATEKLQLLIDSGIENDQLFFNLAQGYFRLGKVGDAVANYRRALRLNPTSQLYRQQLALAEQQTPQAKTPADETWASLRGLNDLVLQFVSPRSMKGLFIAAWTAFWGIIVLRTLRVQFHWKTAACATLLLAALTGGSYLLRIEEFVADDAAVLTEPVVTIREGDGLEFPKIQEIQDAEGRLVQILDRRGGWVRIALDRVGSQPPTTGWILQDESEPI